MKKSLIILGCFIAFSCVPSPVHSVTINDPWALGSSEKNLREIWNMMLNDDFSGSSQDLYTAYGVGRTDPELESWWSGTSGAVCAEIRYAGYEQSFGYTTSTGQSVTLASNIPWGINETFLSFDVTDGTGISWSESWNSGSGAGRWYSDTSMNSDLRDHFVAFEVPRGLFNYTDEKCRLYMLGFEDLSLGDQDYQDLVVFLRAVSPVAPVPEPSTLVLLGLGMMGLGSMRRMFRRWK